MKIIDATGNGEEQCMSAPPSINPARTSLTNLLAIPVPEIRAPSKTTITVVRYMHLMNHLDGARDVSEES